MDIISKNNKMALEKLEKKKVVIKEPNRRMRSENVIRDFMKKYWDNWSPDAMDICAIKTGRFKLFISLGYKLASFELRGTRQEVYNDIVQNDKLNAKIRKIKIHALLNPVENDEE